MRSFKLTLTAVLAILAGVGLAGAGAAFGQTAIEERDSHYRLGPNAPYHHYRHYRPPLIHYPRRPEDVERPRPSPRIELRDPGGPRAPHYGAPPPALERVPRL